MERTARAGASRDLEPLLERRFWQALAPDLHVDAGLVAHPVDIGAGAVDDLRRTLLQEGYGHLRAPGLRADWTRIASLFDTLVDDLGLPPVFSLVFDEAWRIHAELHDVLTALLGEYARLPEFWAWRVLPGEPGWPEHRDKWPDCLFPDRSPKTLTAWIPITRAHPLNGCIWMLPADRDASYGVDARTAHRPGSVLDIRPLPADAGDVLLWTGQLLHWSARADARHDLPPRMSLAFEFQRLDVKSFNKPLLDALEPPSFEERLALIALQVLQYRHMHGQKEGELVRFAEEIQRRMPLPRSVDRGAVTDRRGVPGRP